MALRMGAEDKKKAMIAGALGLVVLFLAGRMIIQSFSSSDTAAPAAPVVAAQPAAPGGNSGHAAIKLTSANLDPTLHPEWMAATESMTYSGSGRNIFSALSAPVTIEKPKAPARPLKVVATVVGPPPPPPLPVIDLKFFGFSAAKTGVRKAFLLHGEDVFIANEGDVVDRRYRVVRILPLSVMIEDLPYKNTQTLPLIQN